MTEVKTKPSDSSVAAFVAAIPDVQRRADCEAVVALMQEATGELPVMWGDSIIGFGRYVYRYQSGRTGEWPKVGVAPRKEALTIYFCGYLDGYADLLERLGKHKAGKGCLYVKRLSDIDLAVLQEMVARSLAISNGSAART